MFENRHVTSKLNNILLRLYGRKNYCCLKCSRPCMRNRGQRTGMNLICIKLIIVIEELLEFIKIFCKACKV